MNKAQKIEALRNKGISVENSASAEQVNALYATHCVENNGGTNQQSQVVAEKIVVLGEECEIVANNSQKVVDYIKAKKSKEFPDFLAEVPQGEYEVVGQSTFATWIDKDGNPVTFCLPLLKSVATGKKHACATWDLTPRMSIMDYSENKENGVEYTPSWVCKIQHSSSSQRDLNALNVPIGTRVWVKHRPTSMWYNPLKKATRTYTVNYIEDKE